MPSDPTPPPARNGPPDPYAELWAGADRRRSAHRRSRRHTLRVSIVGVIAVVVAGLLAVPLVQQWVPAGESSAGGTFGTEPEPSAAGAKAAAPADPFTGTPAARYARGRAGLVLPRPAQVGTWGSAEVAKVLRRTRDVLVAARLDPRVVEQGRTAGYLQLLAPATRPMVRTAISKGGPGLGYVTRLGPGSTLDESAAIRVAGKMTARAGKDGQLIVNADYVWVYPLKSATAAADDGPGATLVVLHTVESYEWYRPEAIAASDRGLRPGGGNSYTFNMDCTLVRNGLLALPPPGQKGRPSGPDDKAYSPSTKPGTVPSTC